MKNERNNLFSFNVFESGMVYFTVASQGSVPGAIKRAYIPSVDDGNNNIGAAVALDIKYITTPDGIAVDWVGRCVEADVSHLTSLHPSSTLWCLWPNN